MIDRRTMLRGTGALALMTIFSKPLAAEAAPSNLISGFVVWSDSTGQVWPKYLSDATGLPLYNNGDNTIVGASRVGESLERMRSFPFAQFPNYAHLVMSGHVDCNLRYDQPEIVAPTHQEMADLVASKLGRGDRFMSISLTNYPGTGAVDAPDYYNKIIRLGNGSTSVNQQLANARGPFFAPLQQRMGTTASPLYYLRDVAKVPVTDEDINNVKYDKCPPDTMRTQPCEPGVKAPGPNSDGQLCGNEGHFEPVGKKYFAREMEVEFVRLGWSR